MKRKVLVFMVAGLVAGCVSTNVTTLTNKSYAPVHPDDVVIYLDEADIPGKYEKVALMYSEGDHNWTSESDMLKDARKQAGKAGANGVLLQRIKEPGTGAKVAQAMIGTEANRHGEMIAIYVLPEASGAPSGSKRVY